jgi:hypothetical protein
LLLLTVVACGSGDKAKSADKSTTTRTTASAVASADASTPFGTTVALGKPAMIRYAANPKRQSLLRITVLSVRRGRISDLRSFQLDRRSMTSNLFYAKVRVRNVGNGDVGGQRIPLYALVSETQVVPAVVFGSTFAPCSSSVLRAPFRKNASAEVCLAFLSPRHGKVSQIQWRIPKSDKAIAWKLH